MSIFLLLQWVSASVINGLDTARSPVSEPFSISYVQTMGIVMLNMGCATIIPSWVNIKSMHVRTQSVMWATVSVSATFYIVIGVFFSLGFDSNFSNNSLQSLLDFGKPKLLCQITVALYSYVMLLPSVPVNFTISYQNLTQNKVFGKYVAKSLCFVLPLFVCIPLQTRNYLFLFLTWTTLVFAAVANFILPLVVYLEATKFRKEFNSERILTPHQIELLVRIHSDSHEIGHYIQGKDQQHKTVPGSGSISTSAPALKLIPSSPVKYPPEEDDLNQENSVNGSNSRASSSFEEIIHDFYQQPNVGINVLQRRKQSNSILSLINQSSSSMGEYSKISFKFPLEKAKYPQLRKDTFKPIIYETKPTIGQNGLLAVPENIRLSSSSSKDSYLAPRSPSQDSILDPKLGWLEEDLPDPEAEKYPTTHEEIPLNVFGSDQASFHSHLSNASLPRDPHFKAPPFRAVPIWVPFSSRKICIGLLSFMILMSVVNIFANVFFSSTGKNQ